MTTAPPLVALEQIGHEAAGRPLFSSLSLTIHPGERLGVIGPNGCGKSTLARILVGQIDPDSGKRTLRRGTRCAYVPQDCSFGSESNATVAELLAKGVARAQDEVPELSAHGSANLVLGALKFADLEGLEHRPASELSGGQRKRLQILIALIQEPLVLVMDEPTNHLDFDTTEWLEEAVLKILESPRSLVWGGAVEKSTAPAFVLVSHDRALLDTLVNRIIELDRGAAMVFEGNYSSYLEARATLDVTSKHVEARLAGRMRQEMEWLNRGPQGRGTKQQARIDRAAKLDEKLNLVRARNQAIGAAALHYTSESKQGFKLSKQVLLDIKGLTLERQVSGSPVRFFENLELKLRPSMRLAIIGPNGCGKSTLMQHVANLYNPKTQSDGSTVHYHEHCKLAVLDQERIIPTGMATIRDLILPGGGDTVHTAGRPVHVSTFLESFRFRHTDLNLSLAQLSGGERARILLARTLLDEPNMLILDEPTNDLDLWILRDLEQSLLDFQGTILFTSHDRYFLRRIATHYLAWTGSTFSGNTKVMHWTTVADLDQALALAPTQSELEAPKRSGGQEAIATPAKPKKQSFKDSFRQQELEKLIPTLESRCVKLTDELDVLYASGAKHSDTTTLSAEISTISKQIDACYEELDGIMSRL